jgi:hypothetical protein
LPVSLKNRLLYIYCAMSRYVSGLPYVIIKYVLTWGRETAADHCTTLAFVHNDRYNPGKNSIRLLVSARI